MLKLLSLSLLSYIAAAVDITTVSVIEVGPGGVVRKTTTANPTASPDGVKTFWASLHNMAGRRGKIMQQPGMSMVPDFFNQPDGGMIIGMKGDGIDLDSMDTLSSIVDSSRSDVVGHFWLKGSQSKSLLRSTRVHDKADKFGEALKKSAESVVKHKRNRVESLAVDVEEGAASKADAYLKEVLDQLKKETDMSGETVVVHVVVEEHDSKRRRLDDMGLADDDVEEDNVVDNGNEDDTNLGYKEGQIGNIYYGYGFYNADKEWVTPFRTMSEIQYYNVVLWSSVGLGLILLTAMGMMIGMPLYPDTLLFGQSGKMMAEE